MEADTTELGRVLIGVYSLVGVALTALLAAGTAWVIRRSKGTWQDLVLSRVWELVSSTVAHVEVHSRPMVAKALADGRLTAQEAAELKGKALELVKQGLGEAGLEQLEKIMGTSAVGTYLSGLIERALGLQRAAKTLPPPQPTSSLPTAEQVIAGLPRGASEATVAMGRTGENLTVPPTAR